MLQQQRSIGGAAASASAGDARRSLVVAGDRRRRRAPMPPAPPRRRPLTPPAAAGSSSSPPPPPPPLDDPSAPLTPEELVERNRRLDAAREDGTRQAMRDRHAWEAARNGGLGAGPRGERAGYWKKALRAIRDAEFSDINPKAESPMTELFDATNRFPAAVAAEAIGLGTWRLRGSVDPTIELAAARLEGLLREVIDDELGLYPPDKWKAKQWDYMDTEDPGNATWGGWAHVDAPDPRRGEKTYPRLQVENRVYCSRVYRKLHLEIARRQDGLCVLHAVFYPRLDHDVPIFAMDLVAAGGQVTLAIVDCCPVSANSQLPPAYYDTMLRLQAEHLPFLGGDGAATGAASGGGGAAAGVGRGGAGGSRTIPDWGRDIFSPLCVCVRPRSGAELAGFVDYATALCRAHLQLGTLARPLNRERASDARRLGEIAAAHKRFCDRQLANAKTARVLEAAFGADATREYMRGLMFDFDPSDAPPWFDQTLTRVHRHLTRTDPVTWDGLARAEKLQSASIGARSQATLRGVAAFGALAANRAADRGGPAGARLGEAVQWLVESDPAFRAAAAQLGGSELLSKGKGWLSSALSEVLKEEEGKEGGGGGKGGEKGGSS